MTVVTEALLPRLLAGMGEYDMTSLGAHVEVHGRMPDPRALAPAEIIAAVEQAGLLGHGGAAFPTAKKLRAVAARRKPKVLVANGSEGEPPSKKDRMLMRELPHLVLDGASLAARAVGAGRAIVAVAETDARSVHSLERALEERAGAGLRGDPGFELFEVPGRYLSGQESALVSVLNGGDVLPTFGPRPFERGVGGRPTLVQNVETLAHLALIARNGPAWFRGLGTDRSPGSVLVTISGAVGAPGVYETEHGASLGGLLDAAEVSGELRAVLLGGYFGAWIPAERLAGVHLAGEALAEHGAALGAGVIVALGDDACPVAETARIADFFSSESAGQCGPCVNGLGAIADTVQQLASGTAGRGAASDLDRWLAELPRRGACQHPDGAARFVASALRTFAEEFRDHATHGPCERCDHDPVLPVPLLAAGR